FDRNKVSLESEVKLKSTEIEYLKKSEAELKDQFAEMKSEVKTKSKEIQNLKINEAKLDSELSELKSRITRMESEIISKSAKIDNLNLEVSQGVQKLLEKVETNSIDIRSLHTKTPGVTLRARFTEISKLNAWVNSQWTEMVYLRTKDWRLSPCRRKRRQLLLGVC
ncbi:hypothetical protein PENTCL1PPCAC_21237, partial [Pristionchus entomophagus]